MRGGKANWVLLSFVLAACLTSSTRLYAQSNFTSAIDPNSKSFAADIARLNSNLKRTSIPAEQIAGPAAEVFNMLLHQLSPGLPARLSWQLRILESRTGDAFSLPDGSVYADQEMVQLLAKNAGLWAALLSHEIAHVTGQHWMRLAASRRDSLDSRDDWEFFAHGALARSSSSEFSDRDSEEEFAGFSQELELQADADGLKLMVRAGFHPDFMTALYHLMDADERDLSAARIFCATHPGWAKRESKLGKRLVGAIAEFSRRWPDAANSPGGKPPILVFTRAPEVKVSADRKNAEVALPLRCENSSGPARVVLLMHNLPASHIASTQNGALQQAVPCSPDQTMATFDLRGVGADGDLDGEFYVMDDRGWVLARSPRFRVEH